MGLLLKGSKRANKKKRRAEHLINFKIHTLRVGGIASVRRSLQPSRKLHKRDLIPLHNLLGIVFSQNLFDLFWALSFNHCCDFGTSKMQQRLAVHIVGSKDELEKGFLWKVVNELSIPRVFHDFLHLHTSDRLCNLCRFLSLVMLQVLNNKFQRLCIDLPDFNTGGIFISFNDIAHKFAHLGVYPVNLEFLSSIASISCLRNEDDLVITSVIKSTDTIVLGGDIFFCVRHGR